MLGSAPTLVRFPVSRRGSCQEPQQSSPTPSILEEGVGERKEEVDICDFKRMLTQWLMLNHMTVRVSDHFPPRKLAIS